MALRSKETETLILVSFCKVEFGTRKERNEMSLTVQNNYLRENNMVSSTSGKSTENGGKFFLCGISTNQVDQAEKTKKMNPEEEMEVFKQEFYEELTKINNHRTVSNMAINISEDAFKEMKENPEYREKVLNLIKRDFGDSYAPRNCSVLITVGRTLSDYRADSWPVGYDSEFNVRSKNSFCKKANKKDKQKELFEEYLQRRQDAKHIEKKLLNKKIEKENDIYHSSTGNKAYIMNIEEKMLLIKP